MQKHIAKLLKYPRYLYLQMLSDFSHTNEAFDTKVHLIFPASTNYLPNLLYLDYPSNSTFQKSLLDFARTFITTYYKVPAPDVPTLISFLQSLKLDEKRLSQLSEQFSFTPNPDFSAPTDTSRLLLPTYKLVPIRLSFNFTATPDLNVPFLNGLYFFTSTSDMILSNSIFKQLSTYLTSISDDLFYEQKLVIIGDDYVLSKFILSLISLIQQTPILNNASYTIFFIPDKPSRIADFISKKDEVYKRFISQLFNLISNLLPTFNEMSNTTFPILEHTDHLNYENNLWFNDPTPSHMLQFGIQHYLHFAKEICNINIWQCNLKYDEKCIVVPFITYATILLAKKQYQIYYIGVGTEDGSFVCEKQQELTIWSANNSLNANPNDPWLVTTIQTRSSTKTVMVTMLRVMNTKKSPFEMEIDGTKYGPVNEITISEFPCFPQSPNTKPLLRIATFS
ncbi:hypothetical protein GPJ56_008477 [Histomonas meleagridis]|uniref:uncharacterized protein n=1 Tax=Histomonas meleagridis TaxID=135588 RepID=UPI00355A40D7|nr:hypothetical protein GPJ56_008477 [Histomonas meleagridis]KAH0797671.1 hypothetical protein GO595_009300 [Histomonas meleagridis]